MITNTAFTGEVPRTIPRLLPDGAAQIADNCKLVDGSLTPLRYPALTRVVASSSVMFYVKDGTWFEWSEIVDVAPAPIAANRLYITGNGPPQLVVDSSTVFPLALNPPAGALTAAVTGTPDPATQQYYVYTYTYMTQYGEESQPATVSNAVLRSYGMNVTLTGFEDTLQVRGITSINIYRSQTDSNGTTNFYFIANVPVPVVALSFVDNVEANIDQQLLPSLNFDPPVDTLSGIIPLPNGMMAAFSGKNLYFAQPWEPHAWPQMYSLATDYNIVGIAAFGQSIAVITDGYPYVVTGINPSAMTMERLDVNYPGVSKRSIVNLGYSVAYASTDGLVSISGQGAQMVTGLFTTDQWRTMNPSTFVSAQYMGLYVFCYSYVNQSLATVQGSILIDMTGAYPFLTRSDLYSSYLFFEVGAGKLYFLMGNAVGEFDALNSSFMNMTWRTKKYVLPGETNFGACFFDGAVLTTGYGPLVGLPTLSITDANVTSAIYSSTDSGAAGFPTPPAIPAQFAAKIISDGVLTTTVNTMNAVQRLTSGFLARTWEIEISGINQITSLALAGSPFEFQVQQ